MAKYLFAIATILLSCISHAETLVTKNFTIEVHPQCAEGEVTCNDIQFIVKVAGYNSEATVRGSTLHSVCVDGETTCAFQGYTFFLNGGQHILHASGVLEVVDKEDNPLLLEQGQWLYK